MTTDLATTQPSPLAQLLADPDRLKEFPIETVERLFALDREMRQDGAQNRNSPMRCTRLQGDLTPVRKAAKNDQTGSWYARLEDVEAMLDPVIHKHGFSTSLSSQPGAPADHTRFVLMVRHVGGHAEEHTWDAPIDDKGIKGNPNKTRLHGGGSSMAYAARYLKTNVFSVSTYRDDDGNAAGTGRRRRSRSPKQQFQQQLNDLADQSGGVDKLRLASWLKSSFGVDALAKFPARQLRARVKLMLEDRAKKGDENG